MIPLKDSVSSRSWPVVNVLLILANVAVFVKELSFPDGRLLEAFLHDWGVVPLRLLSYPWEDWPTIFSSMFMHGGWAHVGGNMLYLWIFGDNVEDRMGHFRYLLFYLLVGAAATLTQVSLNPASRIPLIGASGAIAGVLGAYFVLYPTARVLTLVPIFYFIRVVEIPALFFLGFWFVMQALQGMGSLTHQALRGDVGGVAWWAHAGGFVAGLFFVGFFKRPRLRRRGGN